MIKMRKKEKRDNRRVNARGGKHMRGNAYKSRIQG